MLINDERNIEGLERVGAAVAAARDAMGAQVAPGVTTAELDAIGKRILDRYGASNGERSSVVSESFAISAGMVLDATSMKIQAFQTPITDGIEPCCELDSSSQ